MPGELPVIVFINHWAKNIGGAECSLMDILEHAAPRCRAHLITTEQGRLTEKAARFGVQCHVLACALRPGGKDREHFFRLLFGSWKTCVSFLSYAAAAAALVKALRPDCIHANVPKSHATLIFLALMGYRGMCCFHVREIFTKGSLPYFFYAAVFPRKRSRVIAISEAVKSNLPRRMQKRAVVIYNGVAVPQRIIRKPHHPIAFLYVGRVVPWKGCHHLVEIFAQVHKSRPHSRATLTLIGDTLYWSQDYRESLTALIRGNGLTDHCFLQPHTDDPHRAFQAHDIFCNASCNEPFGRSIAEAQAEGLPVIAFDSGGIKEIVEHEKTGILVPYGNVDGFVRAMERFLDHPENIAAMGDRGHERAKKFFNRDIQVPRICEKILECGE